MTQAPEIHGLCPARFNAVKDAFAANFTDAPEGLNELAARFSVTIDGEVALDLWAGSADLAGKKVISTRGTTNDQELTKIAPPGTQITRFDDDATSLTAMVSGQADIWVTTPMLMRTVNEKNPSRQLEVKFTIKANMAAVGMRKGEPRLKEKIDTWVRTNLKNGQLNAIYKKYHQMDLPAEVLNAGS